MLDFNRSNGNGVINLKKNEGICLTKEGNLDKILVGLGWEANDQVGGYDFDLDASVYMLSKSGRVIKPGNFIFFNNLESPCGSVMHMGDNLVGGSGGDDESIKVKLSQIPEDVHSVVFAVTIYEAQSRRQNFGQVRNAYIRVMNEVSGKELVRYDLTDDYSSSSSVIVAELKREGKEWKFNATGEGMRGEIDAVCKKYGLNV